MIDGIKMAVYFGADKETFDDYLRELSLNVRIRRVLKNDKYELYTGKVFKDFDALDASNKKQMKKHHCMKLSIHYHSDGVIKLKLNNSIRKWYYGADSLKDLCKSDYEDALNLLADKLCLAPEFMKDFINYYIEVGVTTIHEANFLMFMLTIIDHKYLKRQLRVNNETVSHIGENKTVSCYDKNNEVKKKKSKRKLKEEFFYLRSEIKINKVSGVKFVYENLSTVGNLLENWSLAYDYLYKEMQYLKFIDCISPNVVDHLILSQKLNKNKNKNKEFHDLVSFLGIDSIGWSKFRDMSVAFTNKPSSIINTYAELDTKFRQLQKPSYRQIYFSKLKARKAEIMK